jgi:hypothetical protein
MASITQLFQSLGLIAMPEPKPTMRQQADKDSLRFHQAWFNQWDDERQNEGQRANFARDQRGLHISQGFSALPVRVDFSKSSPSAPKNLIKPDEQAYLSSPQWLRTSGDRMLRADATMR